MIILNSPYCLPLKSLCVVCSRKVNVIIFFNLFTCLLLLMIFVAASIFILCGGARGVMVIIVGNGHGDTSSNSR